MKPTTINAESATAVCAAALAALTASAGLLPPETGIGWKNGWVDEWKGDVLKPFIPGILLYGNPSNKGRRDWRVPGFMLIVR